MDQQIKDTLILIAGFIFLVAGTAKISSPYPWLIPSISTIIGVLYLAVGSWEILKKKLNKAASPVP